MSKGSLAEAVLTASQVLVDRIAAAEPQSVAPEIMLVAADCAAVVVEIEGVDFILTISRLDVQRPRARKI